MITVSPRLHRQARELEHLLEQGGRPDDPSLRPLLDLATFLRPGPPSADPAFRAALRERLVAEASRRTVPAQSGPGARVVGTVPVRRRPHRARRLVAGLALTAVVAGTGSAFAASRALPGDPLYGLKRDIERAQLALTHGDVGKGRELLQQADSRLSEVERMASGENAGNATTQERISASLAAMDADLRQATDLLTQAYRDTGDPEPMRILARFLTDQRERLADLLPLLPAPTAAQAQALLQLVQQIQAGADAVIGGTALAAPGLAGLVAAARAAPGAGSAGGGSLATGAGTGSTPTGGTAGSSLDGVVGSVDGAVGGVTGGLTAGSGTGHTTATTTTPLPQVSVPPLLPAPPASATSTTSSGGVLPSLPLSSPTLTTCLPLIQHC